MPVYRTLLMPCRSDGRWVVCDWTSKEDNNSGCAWRNSRGGDSNWWKVVEDYGV